MAATSAALSTMLMLAGVAPGAASASCGFPKNEIERENCLPGTPSGTWEVDDAGSASIQGFATDISVDQSETVRFKVDTTASDYRLDIYRMGYYGGAGARRVTTIEPTSIRDQPSCNTQASTGLIECSNWSQSAAWVVPGDAVSGIYFAHLVREDGTAGTSHVVFIVRDDDGASDVLFQTADTTWQAYNDYGGNSLYKGEPDNRAYKVSYDRPFNTRANAGGEDWLFNAEYPTVRWLERNGYDVSYTTGVDSDRRGALIRQHPVFLSVGHDEYWSGTQRANVVAARDAGVDLMFLSGNEVFWKTRWEDNHRTLVCYKETHETASIDPDPAWTGTWRDARPFNPQGAQPENALTGTAFTVNAGTTAIQVPPSDGRLRLWRNSDVAVQAAAGGTATLAEGSLGYEWDEDLDNGFRPDGLVRMSSTTATVPQKLQDYGSIYGPGVATHHVTLYRDPNGAAADALVFGAGTIQWAWGLDGEHDRGGRTPSRAMQQATANMLADMGVHAGSLQSDLSAPTASTDTTAPTSTITSTGPGSVSGTAADSGGGRVGGVEVSTNGGLTWHPAVGRENWSYTFTPAGTTNLRTRAVDDSGNLGPPVTNPDPPPGGGGGGSPGGGSPGGGSPGGGGSSGGAIDLTPSARPRARVKPRRVRVASDGLVRLRVTCAGRETGCSVSLRLRHAGRSLVSRRFIVTGGARTVRIYLDRAARRKLALARALRVTAVTSVPDGAGGHTVTRSRIRLLAPRGR